MSACVYGTVTIKVCFPLDRAEAEMWENSKDGANILLRDKVDALESFGDLGDVLDTFEVGGADIIWEAE